MPQMDQVAEFQEAMMFYRKACIEWGEAKTIDNHDRAIAAQVEVLSLYRAALAFQPEEQAEPLTAQSIERIIAALDESDGGYNEIVRYLRSLAPQPDRSEEQAQVPSVGNDDDGEPHTVETLARWLEVKYSRHGEDEDRAAAAMLRALAVQQQAEEPNP